MSVTVDLDFEDDQQWLDDLEEVTYTSKRTAGDVAVVVPDATFEPLGTQEAANSRGVYTATQARFTIRRSLLIDVGGAKVADTVTRSGGTVFVVTQVTPPVVAGVWLLTGRAVGLHPDLSQLGTLSRPSNAQTAAGRPALDAYTVVAADIACRVQPADFTAADVMARRTTPKRFTAFLAVQVEARAKDVFECEGVRYTVAGAGELDQLAGLMTLTLETIP